MTAPSRPSFRDPPVREVTLAVAFGPIAKLTSVDLGVFWQFHCRERLPLVSERMPAEPIMETFGGRPAPVRVQVRPLDVPPVPRLWFESDDRAELLQVQRDWLGHTWRRLGPADEYPRYEKVRSRFSRDLEDFTSFLAERGMAKMDFTQCEVTYHNVITPVQGVWESHADLDKVTSVWDASPVEFLPEMEAATLQWRHVLRNEVGEPIGRLRVSIRPGTEAGDPTYSMSLTARGRPGTADQAGVLEFLDAGRDLIVKGFTALTTKPMHNHWGKQW